MGQVAGLRCPRRDTHDFSTIAVEGGVLAQCGDCQGLFVEGEPTRRFALARGGPPDRRGGEMVGAALDDWNMLTLIDDRRRALRP